MITPALSARSLLTTSLTAIGAMLLTANASAQILRVSTFGANSNSGYTWGTALRTVQKALNLAATDPSITRIEVAAGTYKPGGSRSSSFQLVDGVTLIGGYPAAGGSTSDPDSNVTVLSGDIGTAGDITDNCYTVVLALNTSNARLEGFRIRRGNADGATTGPFGHGGGLYAEDASLLVTKCRFYKNTGRMGGAASLWSTALTFSDCRFVDNAAGVGGGAIASTATTNGGPCDVMVNRCWLLGNFGQTYGGAIWNSSKMSVYDSVLSGNQSFGYGGAISSATDNDTTRVANCTLANNVAATAGGAYYEGSGNSDLVNSIFWDNTASGASTEIAPAGVSAHHCDIDDLTGSSVSGYANIDADPEFVDALGGDGVAGTADDNPRIERGSPCINAGDNAAVPIFATLDIDRASRIQRPMLIMPSIVDIGANEIGPLTILFPGTIATIDLDIEVDGSAATIGGTDAVLVPGGSRLEARLLPNASSQVGLPCGLTLDSFVGSTAPSFPGLPGVHFGLNAVTLLFPALPAQGQLLVIDPIPQGLAGSMMLQGHVLSPQAANGLFASSRGRELRFQ